MAGVLQFDAAASGYLLAFIAPLPPDEQPPASVLNLLEILDLPAFVTGATFDVLASNAIARALSPELAPGRDRLRSVFFAPTERALYRDWDTTAQRFVALVRETARPGAGEEGFAALVEEMAAVSPRFRELWDRHDVVARDTEVATFDHPAVGALRLHLERLDILGTAGHGLVLHHSEAGSADAARLAGLRATDHW